MMDLRSKADLRREVARLEAEVAKREAMRVSQEQQIDQLLRELRDRSVGTCTESMAVLPGRRLDCSLLAGHTGRHRTEDGAEWWTPAKAAG